MADIPEVRVLPVGTRRPGEPGYILFRVPELRIHEDGVAYLSELASRASLYQRNVAYSLSHWLNFCSAKATDYRWACEDDLIHYRDTLSHWTSEKTGRRLSSGTIGIRVRAVCHFYAAGKRGGWNMVYQTNCDSRDDHESSARPRSDTSRPIDEHCLSLAPRPVRSSTAIKIIEPADLRKLLDILGPSEDELSTQSSGPLRNRLIAEWMIYTGLRLEEVIGARSGDRKVSLEWPSIESSKSVADAPYANQPIIIVGKFSKKRTIAAPNWLIERTKWYIRNERRKNLSNKSVVEHLFVTSLKCAATYRYKPLSLRRYQAIFSEACKAAGLIKLERGVTNSTKVVARHSCHDLRHTYAVMHYFAEVAMGNSEPWKMIQAQLGHSSLQTTVDTYLQFVSIHTNWRVDLRLAGAREAIGLAYV